MVAVAAAPKEQPSTAELILDYRQDPRYQAVNQKLVDLRTRYSQLTGGDVDFHARLQKLAGEIEAVEVKQVLGEYTASELSALRSQREKLEHERREHVGEAPRVKLAIEELEQRLRVVENEVITDLRPKILAEIKRLSEEMAPHLKRAVAINDRLMVITNFASGWASLPVRGLSSLEVTEDPHGGLPSPIAYWLRTAREAGYKV